MHMLGGFSLTFLCKLVQKRRGKMQSLSFFRLSENQLNSISLRTRSPIGIFHYIRGQLQNR